MTTDWNFIRHLSELKTKGFPLRPTRQKDSVSDGYCKKHFISYCPDLSKTCPYCRITELTKDRCEWGIAWMNEYEYWAGTCGLIWEFTAGGPIENEVNFCPKCGGEVRLKEG